MSKKPLKPHFKPIKPINLKESLQKKKQRIQKKIKKYIKKAHEIVQPHHDEPKEEPQGIIEEFNPDENTLNLYFKRGNKTLFKDIKNRITNKINEFHGVKGVYLQMFYYVDGEKKCKNFSLNNEEGYQMAMNILNGKSFELIENPFEARDETFIQVSDDSRVSNFSLPISCITGFRLCNKKHLTDKSGKQINVYCDNGGSFYPYKIKSLFENNQFILNILKRYQITNDLKDKMFEVNCLTYALKMSGKFNDNIIDNFKIDCYTRYISQGQLNTLGNKYNIAFNVVKYDKSNNAFKDITKGKKVIGSNETDAIKIDLALIHDHYILNEDVQGINKYSLEHYEEIKQSNPDKSDEWLFKVVKKSGNNYRIDNKQAHIKSYELIKMISSNIPFSFEELEQLPTSLYDLSKSEIKDISAFTEHNFILNQPKDKKEKKEDNIYFYADTECDITGDYHIAYCIPYVERGSENIKTIIGENCLEEFLNILPNNAVVYFHNLGYDAKMFSKFDIQSSIDKGTRTMSQKFKYNGKNIIFKDSLSILSMPLAKFPSIFHLKSGEKEMFPYKYYTIERLNKNVGIISEAGNDELKNKWNQEQFEHNIEKLGLYLDESHETFNMKEYVKYYCEQDVRILAEGFDKFREMCLNALKIDIDEVLTAPSLANKYFEQNLYHKIPNFYKYSGIPRAFIQQAIYGGRCMTRDNLKWETKCNLNDFDAIIISISNETFIYSNRYTILIKRT